MRTFLPCLLVGLFTIAFQYATLAADTPVDEGADTATHKELEPLNIEFETLSALRLHTDGNLLAGDSKAKTIKVIDPDGKVARTIELPFGPESINVATDGTIYCGGQGRIAKLDAAGKILKNIPVPEKAKASADGTRSRWNKPQRVSGIAVTDKDVFVAFGSSWSLRSTSVLLRMDRDLENVKQIAEDLRGCCQRCDIVADDRGVYIAENSLHRVVLLDRDGERLNKWGKRSREGLEGFGACCNPMNLSFDAKGVLYASESGLARVKRYAKDGKYLGLVGYVGTQRFTQAGHLASTCSNIAIAATPDGSRVYVMDYKGNRIRVLQKK